MLESAGQDTLAQLRQDVREPVPTDSVSPERSRQKTRGYCDDDEEHGGFYEAAGRVIGFVITIPFWGPPVWVGDDYQSLTYLSGYPHQHDVSAYVLTAPNLPESEEMFFWASQVRVEYADTFDNLCRYSGHALWESHNRLGLDASVDYMRESLTTGTHDELWTGDFNVVFRFAQCDWLVMRSGLGASFLADDDRADVGLNFTYGGDWFPARPWIVSAEIDWGWLGHAGLFHSRATVGMNLRNVEIYTGLDYSDIGSVQIGAMVAGLRFWH